MILPSNEEIRWKDEETQRSAKNANLYPLLKGTALLQ